MKDWGTVRSAKQPESFEIDDFSVWIASEIKEVQSERMSDENTEKVAEWVYHLMQYDKDEYIKIMSEKNASLESQIEVTQEAVDYLLLNTGA